MELLNTDPYINMLLDAVNHWWIANPKTVALITFVVGWLMKKAPWFERMVNWAKQSFGRS